MFRTITPVAAMLAAFLAAGAALAADSPPPKVNIVPYLKVACDTPESLITDALKGDEKRLLVKLTGTQIDDFVSYLVSKGWFSGTIERIDTLYVITAALRPGFSEPHVWLFFVMDGCVMAKIPAQLSAIQPGLPK